MFVPVSVSQGQGIGHGRGLKATTREGQPLQEEANYCAVLYCSRVMHESAVGSMCVVRLRVSIVVSCRAVVRTYTYGEEVVCVTRAGCCSNLFGSGQIG